MVKSLRHFGKSKSLPASTKLKFGPEDDCVIAQRLAQLCLAKYPSLSAIPPPTKFEKQIPSFSIQRAYSVPAHTGESVDKVSFAIYAHRYFVRFPDYDISTGLRQAPRILA